MEARRTVEVDGAPSVSRHGRRSAYDGLRLPVSILLDNVRSMYNVGAFFRTADGAGIERLLLSGITARPPKNEISKTALGAEDRVAWEAIDDLPGTLQQTPEVWFRNRGYRDQQSRCGFVRLAATFSGLCDVRPRGGWYLANLLAACDTHDAFQC